jgi:hypothetical protein
MDRVDAGVAFWRKMGWPADFHNCFYVSRVPAIRPVDGVFDIDWWNRFWPVLQEWSATRRGGGRKLMTQRAQDQFLALTECSPARND